MSIVDKWDNQATPFLLRIIAQRYGKPVGPNEIASRSGLSRSTVQRLSRAQTWKGIRVEVADSFAKGCGYDLSRLGPAKKKLKQLEEHGLSSLRHLKQRKHAPLWRKGATANTKKFVISVISAL